MVEHMKPGRRKFQVRDVPGPGGSLRPVLHRRGLPMVLPNLWASSLATDRRNTLHAYLSDVARLHEGCEAIGLQLSTVLAGSRELTTTLASRLAHAMFSSKDSRATAERVSHSARGYLQYGFDENLYRTAPAQYRAVSDRMLRSSRRLLTAIKKKKADLRLPGRSTQLSSTEVEALLSEMRIRESQATGRAKVLALRDLALVTLALESLPRRSELVLAQLDDLDLELAATIRYRNPAPIALKSRRDGAHQKTIGRQLPLSRDTAALLQRYIDEARPQLVNPRRPCSALFLSARDGRRLAASTLNKIVNAAASRCGSDLAGVRVHPHALRVAAANLTRQRLSSVSNRADTEDALTYAGGWSPRSSMPQYYTERAIANSLRRSVNGGKRQ